MIKDFSLTCKGLSYDSSKGLPPPSKLQRGQTEQTENLAGFKGTRPHEEKWGQKMGSSRWLIRPWLTSLRRTIVPSTLKAPRRVVPPFRIHASFLLPPFFLSSSRRHISHRPTSYQSLDNPEDRSEEASVDRSGGDAIEYHPTGIRTITAATGKETVASIRNRC